MFPTTFIQDKINDFLPISSQTANISEENRAPFDLSATSRDVTQGLELSLALSLGPWSALGRPLVGGITLNTLYWSSRYSEIMLFVYHQTEGKQ